MRLLARGELKAKVNITLTGATAAAIAAVEKAGGTVTFAEPAQGGRSKELKPARRSRGCAQARPLSVTRVRSPSPLWPQPQNNLPRMSISRPSPKPRNCKSGSCSR
ncbi:MAG: uL15 family ribosomal protein [Terricaulis sp.]|nr:uL15 family ribosomal protein [Terricaulis sp.]